MTAPSPTGDLADRLEKAIKAVDAPSNKHGQDFRDERDKRLEGLGEEVCQIGAELVAALRASAPADPSAGRGGVIEAIRALKQLRYYFPDDFAPKDFLEEKKNELYQHGDMRVVFVNQGDMIMLDIAIRALKSAAPAEDVGRGEPNANALANSIAKGLVSNELDALVAGQILPTADREAIRETLIANLTFFNDFAHTKKDFGHQVSDNLQSRIDETTAALALLDPHS